MSVRHISRLATLHVSQKRGERVHRKVTGVVGGWGQASDFADQLFPAQFAGFGYSLVFHQLGDCRTAGHGWDAALGAEANIDDAHGVRVDLFRLFFQFQGEFQNVSADGVFQARGAIGSFKFSRVSRILKMIEQFRGIHRAIVIRALDFLMAL